jgi:hypothetical protein
MKRFIATLTVCGFLTAVTLMTGVGCTEKPKTGTGTGTGPAKPMATGDTKPAVTPDAPAKPDDKPADKPNP